MGKGCAARGWGVSRSGVSRVIGQRGREMTVRAGSVHDS